MTAPLQLKPEEVDELEHMHKQRFVCPYKFAGKLISDWRTLTAEREEMRKEIERLRQEAAL